LVGKLLLGKLLLDLRVRNDIDSRKMHIWLSDYIGVGFKKLTKRILRNFFRIDYQDEMDMKKQLKLWKF
jgi:hypothetical protein